MKATDDCSNLCETTTLPEEPKLQARQSSFPVSTLLLISQNMSENKYSTMSNTESCTIFTIITAIANEMRIRLPHRGVIAIGRISWLKWEEAVSPGINVTLNVKDPEENNDVENVYSTNTGLKYY